MATSDSDRVLNASEISKCVQRSPGELSENLPKMILKLFSDFLSPDGKYVDYKGIAKSAHFEVILSSTHDFMLSHMEHRSYIRKS